MRTIPRLLLASLVALPIALAPPAHHDFVLKWRGQNTFVLPGIPTFTQWRVSIVCKADDVTFPDYYDETVTY